MGIPRVRWEKNCEGSESCNAEHCGWPVSDIAVNPMMEGCPEPQKLFGRSMIQTLPSTSKIECAKTKYADPINSVLLNSLTTISRLLWTVMQLSWDHPSAGDISRNRNHTRVWKQA